jgi:FkbM family methyltransferase
MLGRVEKDHAFVVGAIAAATFIAGIGVGRWLLPCEADAAVAPAAVTIPEKGVVITEPGVSVYHHPFMPIPTTPDGKAASIALIECLDGKKTSCDTARTVLEEASARENFGGEYPTLLWFADYLQADEKTRLKMEADPEGARFVWYWRPEGWLALREVLEAKADLRAKHRVSDGHSFLFLDEVLRFNGPGRESWEKTSGILDALALKPGMVVADIGAASGYHSFHFARAVAPNGTVYAVELDEEHLEYLRQVKEAEHIDTMQVVPASTTTVGLPANSVDLAFLSGTYQAVYGSVRESEREAWIRSLHDVLRDDGRLVVVDNVPDGELAEGLVPYRGITLSKALVIGQLEAHGFQLVAEHPTIPQRYVLVFREVPA